MNRAFWGSRCRVKRVVGSRRGASMTARSGIWAMSFGAKRLLIAMTAALGPLLAGCDREPRLDDTTAVMLNRAEVRHPIEFSSANRRMTIEVPHDTIALNAEQEDRVYRFLSRYRSEGGRSLKLLTPKGKRERDLAMATVRRIGEIALDLGIERNAISVLSAHADRSRWPLVELGYTHSVALPPGCGGWPHNVAEDRERIPYENFGCASQRNLALTVDNARDLQRPREETPRSSERRGVAWSKYIDPKGGRGGVGGEKLEKATAAKTGQE